MNRDKYLEAQPVKSCGIGPNGTKAHGWWYGEKKELCVYIDGNDGSGCHWVTIPRRSIEAWLRATVQQPATLNSAAALEKPPQ